MAVTTADQSRSLRQALMATAWDVMPFALAAGTADPLARILRIVEHATDEEIEACAGRLGWLIACAGRLAHLGEC